MRRMTLCVGAEVGACARRRWDLGAGFLKHEPRRNTHSRALGVEEGAEIGECAG
jgi:hypothetical protein